MNIRSAYSIRTAARRDRASALSSTCPTQNSLDPGDAVPAPTVRFPPRRSSPRLASLDYVGAYAYHVILTTRGRTQSFLDTAVVDACLEQLNRSSVKYGFTIEAYCFMPDHLHLLVVGSDDASLTRFVQHFKQTTGYKHHDLWQRSFYDRVLRYEEDLDTAALYVWSNPVVAGLIIDAADYAFSGPRDRLLGLPEGVAEDRAKALSLQIPSRTSAGT